MMPQRMKTPRRPKPTGCLNDNLADESGWPYTAAAFAFRFFIQAIPPKLAKPK